MKQKFLLFIFLLSICANISAQTVTRDFVTVQSLRTNNKAPKKGEKVYVLETGNLYAADFIDNTSLDDGYNIIITGNTRWKCVSCNVPSKFITQADINPVDKLNPTLAEIKAYMSAQKTPNKNGVFLNYYKKNDTLGIGNMYPYFEAGYDSSRVTSVKINGVEKLTSPIWLYQGGVWVYVDNTLKTLYETNKPSGVNYTVNDDDLQDNYNIVISNITAPFNTEVEVEYWDGSAWSSYNDGVQYGYYTVDYGSGSKDAPLYSYLIVDDSPIVMRGPQTFTDLTLGRSNLAGPRSLNFTSTSGSSTISQLEGSTDIGILGNRHYFSNSQANNATGSLYMWNQYTNSSVINVEHYGNNNRANLNLYRARGTRASRQAVQLNDKLGSFAFMGYDGFNNAGVSSALLEGFVDGTVSNGSVPMRFSVVTGTSFANRFERLVVKADGSILIAPVTFSQLPATGVLAGSLRVINDAASVTYRGNASGGGGNVALVMWTGSGWIYQ